MIVIYDQKIFIVQATGERSTTALARQTNKNLRAKTFVSMN
jgi:hypothetical protein